MNEFELAGYPTEQAEKLMQHALDNGIPPYAVITATQGFRSERDRQIERKKLRRFMTMQYVSWRIQRIFGLLILLILLPIKGVLFFPVSLDHLITRCLYRLNR